MPIKGGEKAGSRLKPTAAARAGTPANKTGAGGLASKIKAEPELAPVTLRIPKGVLARVDRLVRARRAKNPIPRTTWLLDAVNEKLAREERDEDDD